MEGQVYDKKPTKREYSRRELPLNVDFFDNFLSPALNEDRIREFDEMNVIEIKLIDMDSAESKMYKTELKRTFRGPKWRIHGLDGWRTYAGDRGFRLGDTIRFCWLDAASLVLGVRRIPPPAAATAAATATATAAAPPPAPAIDLPPGASVAVPPGISITLPPGSVLTFPIGRPIQIPPGAGLTLPPGTGIILPPGAVLIPASEGEPEPESAPSPVVDPETENSLVAEPDPVVEPEPDLPPLKKRLDLRKVHGNLDLLD